MPWLLLDFRLLSAWSVERCDRLRCDAPELPRGAVDSLAGSGGLVVTGEIDQARSHHGGHGTLSLAIIKVGSRMSRLDSVLRSWPWDEQAARGTGTMGETRGAGTASIWASRGCVR